MKNKLFSILITALSLCSLSAAAQETSSEVIFPTQIIGGNFAPDTHWYTMSVKSARRQAFYADDKTTSLQLRETISAADADLWCFVGNATEGYKIYNKAAGSGKCLAVEKSRLANEASPSFAGEEGLDLQRFANRWDLVPADMQISKDGTPCFYLQIKTAGEKVFALNDFASRGQLKFWEGKDVGSVVLLRLPQQREFSIDLSKGSLMPTNKKKNTKQSRAWQSTDVYPGISLTSDKTEIKQAKDGQHLSLVASPSATYTLQAEEGYVITGFSLDFLSGKRDVVAKILDEETDLQAKGKKVNLSACHLNTPKVSFTLSTENKKAAEVLLSQAVVNVQKFVAPDPAHTQTVFDNANSEVPYRIPALAKTADGKLILAVDYRYCKADIGFGAIDLRYKISDDNGKTWSEEYVNLGKGDQTKEEGNQWDYAFGDPSIVADAENPNEILVMAVGGHVSYWSSTYENPQHVVRFRSHDGGRTWTKGDTLTYQIYNLFNNGCVEKATAIFLTSGKIMQSRYVKVGKYYRLYIAHPCRGTADRASFVIYSDDFGETWQVLGHNPMQKASSGCDESKVEELPDGSVLISCRNFSGGRYFNMFTYTDAAKGEGTWGEEGMPELMKAGVVNACNGEILIVPAVRTTDGKPVQLALQSVPQSSRREKVGFYYKEVTDSADYHGENAIAQNWKKGLCVTPLDACYSTMLLMDNDSIAFVYEESGYNGGYDIVFKSLSLDTITAGKYILRTSGKNTEACHPQGLKKHILPKAPHQKCCKEKASSNCCGEADKKKTCKDCAHKKQKIGSGDE